MRRYRPSNAERAEYESLNVHEPSFVNRYRRVAGRPSLTPKSILVHCCLVLRFYPHVERVPCFKDYKRFWGLQRGKQRMKKHRKMMKTMSGVLTSFVRTRVFFVIARNPDFLRCVRNDPKGAIYKTLFGDLRGGKNG